MTGYESKRAAAQDKLDDDDTQVYQDHDDALTIAYQSGYYDGKKAAQPAQEPVAWMYPDALCDRNCLYVCTKAFTQFPECATTPPQRKPLTDEELDLICEKALFCRISFQQFARSIEAAHDIKE